MSVSFAEFDIGWQGIIKLGLNMAEMEVRRLHNDNSGGRYNASGQEFKLNRFKNSKFFMLEDTS
jgi:hypothetical protein